ncbi:MAG: Phosphoglycerate mutase family protein [Candidatus Woesebacteria bacterium GW2011_GWB1_39_12]|uniref:Phosphoglycerate mutase family protein n=2 Tax=Candidatus Woeseibacteriota TaxID=1752722 RepID=A0A0G0PH14_9BACT|nr:MAG: Phosphoglycerate mutase family protein [Candidatus Woesebacteria bacterium GW2011_GWA1_39_12]KKR00956.1 MAG: Phosphoglycerate mutase family protein [Candidatus Woesebacteria bacterium GW2011_GWB1_39_12]
MEEDLIEFTKITEQKLTRGISRIIVVRHAESVANTRGIYQGQTYDTDLSPLGKKQAEALARKLEGLGISRIISSPLKRTYQTALEVSRICDCPIEVSDLIIETNHGEWEGKNKHLVKELYPEIYDTWLTKPSQAIFPGGEAFVDMLQRIQAFLDNVMLTENTLIITHDNVVRILVTLANGWTLDEIWTHNIEPAALNFFELNKVGGKIKLKVLELNNNKHLESLRSNIKKHAL